MTKQQEVKRLKAEANQPKSGLINLLHQLENVSPSQAHKLERIIIRLEVWQNS